MDEIQFTRDTHSIDIVIEISPLNLYSKAIHLCLF